MQIEEFKKLGYYEYKQSKQHKNILSLSLIIVVFASYGVFTQDIYSETQEYGVIVLFPIEPKTPEQKLAEYEAERKIITDRFNVLKQMQKEEDQQLSVNMSAIFEKLLPK